MKERMRGIIGMVEEIKEEEIKCVRQAKGEEGVIVVNGLDRFFFCFFFWFFFVLIFLFLVFVGYC